jgi:hypothetical protein
MVGNQAPNLHEPDPAGGGSGSVPASAAARAA